MFFDWVVVKATFELENQFRAIRLSDLIVVIDDRFSLQVKLFVALLA